MKCPWCVAEDQTSTLTDRGSMGTLLGGSQAFYDEAGKHHVHNPNTTKTGYRCSRGHSFVVEIKGSCWCGWGQQSIPRVTGPDGVLFTNVDALNKAFGKPTQSIDKHGCG